MDEAAELVGDLLVLRRAEEPTVRHRFPHVQLGVHTCVAQSPVHAHGVGEEQVARARLQERGWEPGEVAEER